MLDNALSIDLEDWYHPLLVRRHLRGPESPSRVEQATAPLLSLLERFRVRATFFCVGDVLRLHPELVRRIHAAGHEIAFHGMHHLPLWELDAGRFDAELVAFDRLVRDTLGEAVRVLGFRAPTFSLDGRTAWALPALARHGYAYDSSVFPMRGPLYGLPGAPLQAYRVAADAPAAIDPASALVEIPPAVCAVAGLRLPVGGGIYLRLLPFRLVAALLRRINRERPFVIYLHPWETDPETPRIRMPAPARLATYGGIDRMLGKVERLLGAFRFTTVSDVVARASGEPPDVPGGARC